MLQYKINDEATISRVLDSPRLTFSSSSRAEIQVSPFRPSIAKNYSEKDSPAEFFLKKSRCNLYFSIVARAVSRTIVPRRASRGSSVGIYGKSDRGFPAVRFISRGARTIERRSLPASTSASRHRPRALEMARACAVRGFLPLRAR